MERMLCGHIYVLLYGECMPNECVYIVIYVYAYYIVTLDLYFWTL